MAKIGLFGLLMWLPELIMPAAWAQVTERAVAVYSEGVRLHGSVFSPPAVEGKHHPAIVMSHGWGGTAALLRPGGGICPGGILRAGHRLSRLG